MKLARILALTIVMTGGATIASLAENGTSHLIQPNDYVGVILTRTHANLSTGDGSPASPTIETIMTNVRVLAIDQRPDDKAGLRIWTGKRFTLELTPDQSKAVTASWSVGMLSLTPHDAMHATISGGR